MAKEVGGAPAAWPEIPQHSHATVGSGGRCAGPLPPRLQAAAAAASAPTSGAVQQPPMSQAQAGMRQAGRSPVPQAAQPAGVPPSLLPRVGPSGSECDSGRLQRPARAWVRCGRGLGAAGALGGARTSIGRRRRAAEQTPHLLHMDHAAAEHRAVQILDCRVRVLGGGGAGGCEIVQPMWTRQCRAQSGGEAAPGRPQTEQSQSPGSRASAGPGRPSHA